MKWKMSERSLFALLLRSPWWASFLLVAAISLASAALLPDAYKAAGVLCSFPFVVIGLMAAWKQRNLISPEKALAWHQYLADMNWREFSPMLTQAFTAQGYSVTPLNQPMADYLITQQGKTTLVCAKRWKAAAWGKEHMQSLVELRDAHQASEVMCISLQTMPRALKPFATQNRINWLSDQALWALLAPVTPQPV